MSLSLTNSQKFLIFWITLIVGLVIGSYANISYFILIWLVAIWLVIFLSGQNEPLETLSLVLFALSVGILIWQLTSGETWLQIGFISKLGGWLITIRDHVVDKIFQALPEPHGSLLTGILLGNRVKLDRDLIQTFRTVGISHVIAVSGYNLTILTKNIHSLFRPLMGRKTIFLSLAVIILFVMITGAPASILRAAVMAVVVLLASWLGRPSRPINLLIMAAGVLAIFEPKIILDVGFELSVAATYGLIRLAPMIERGMKRLPLPKSIIQVISETLSATVMTLPILVIYFERLSVVSPLTNILVVPLIPFLMGLGLVGAIALVVLPEVGRIIALLSWPLLAWIIFISNKLAGLKYSSTNLQLPVWSVISVVLLIVLALEWLNWRLKNTQSDFVVEN